MSAEGARLVLGRGGMAARNPRYPAIRARRALYPIVAVFAACGAPRPPAASTTAAESPEACASRQRELVAFVRQLPDRAVATPGNVELPASVLGRAPGSGAVLEIRSDGLALDGEVIRGRGGAEREPQIRQWLEGWRARLPVGQEPTVYLAAAGSTDVQTTRQALAGIPAGIEVRLLVRTRAPQRDSGATERDIAAEVLGEADAAKREELARHGYSVHARCRAVEQAVATLRGGVAGARWPALRAALLDSLPRCECGELDSTPLRQLIVAEQRAGAAALGSLPLSFLRDERCGASMPLRSLDKLVKQMEAFDAEFAGGWRGDALQFEEVLAHERLLGFFCNALPGETLSARQRARATLFWRVPGSATCQAWQFEPLAPGAPLGTWRRTEPSSPPLAFHYRQAAEEIRLFGPLGAAPGSKPTDDRAWPCEQNYRMTTVDAESVRTETGVWFFSEESCLRGPPEGALTAGCVGALSFEATPEATRATGETHR